ncbi:response regulator, partial [Ectopseudomonas mendocina]
EPSQLLETIAQFSPEVLLLDVNMPGSSGPELATYLQL